MLVIRLQRVGRKNDPSFRVIVTDSKMKTKTGNFLEILGSYDPRKGKPVINTERAKHWISLGAKASGTVQNILIDLKAVSGKKVNVLGRKTPLPKETPTEKKAEGAPSVEAKAEAKDGESVEPVQKPVEAKEVPKQAVPEAPPEVVA